MAESEADSVCMVDWDSVAVANVEDSSRISKDGTGAEHLVMHFNVRPFYNPPCICLTNIRSKDLWAKE